LASRRSRAAEAEVRKYERRACEGRPRHYRKEGSRTAPRTDCTFRCESPYQREGPRSAPRSALHLMAPS
jgi:hypothetical protein